MPDLDVLRLAVAPYPVDPELPDEPPDGDFVVRVYVNEVEMTEAGAGLGMDPFDLLVPPGRLHTDRHPITVPIARCSCRVDGCASTTVVIRRGDHAVVHWDWHRKVPMTRRVSFVGEQYDAAVSRAESDLSWETPERTAGRLIRAALSGRPLAGGLTLDWVSKDRRNAGHYSVWLRCDGPYQIAVDFPWSSFSASELADHIVSTLTENPLTQWTGRWMATIPNLTTPPRFAPAAWPRDPSIGSPP